MALAVFQNLVSCLPRQHVFQESHNTQNALCSNFARFLAFRLKGWFTQNKNSVFIHPHVLQKCL